ncbi:MAG: PilZ domain-containing protein [Qipengyuania sp.]|nr:PilZ domain-containing protein [Qipengyuania sp.]
MSNNPEDRRRRPRISTMILCEIRIGEQPPELVRVRDLSECGIKIATGKTLLLGDRLRVRLPGAIDWCFARVAWCSKGTAGLAFARAMDLPGVVKAGIGEEARRPAQFQPPERIAS